MRFTYPRRFLHTANASKQSLSLKTSLLIVVLALLMAPTAQASMVLKMDLGELHNNADLIFRGRVVSADVGAMQVAGAELATVTYRIDVSEVILGSASSFIEKGDKRMAEITMIYGKQFSADGEIKRLSRLPEMPDLRVGEEYLLTTTTPSSIGLSTTVGLGQGAFHINPKTGNAENASKNASLSATIDGPVPYSQLADEFRALVRQRGEKK